jgi:hypothetical protein
MIEGSDLDVVALFDGETSEELCWECAVRRLGSIHAERIRMGLGQGRWEVTIRYRANETATQNGYECGCEREVEHGEFCENCAESLCGECGARLDRIEEAPPALATVEGERDE